MTDETPKQRRAKKGRSTSDRIDRNPQRDENGRWLPGKSVNPGGYPRGGAEALRVKAIARQHGTEAIATIVEVMRNKAEPGKTRVYAAEILLTRGFGRPEQERPEQDQATGVLNPDQADRVMSLLMSGALTVRNRKEVQ